MSDIYDRVTGDQDVFDKILAKIPGFSGYVERMNRRLADKALREKLATEYELLWGRLSSLQKDLIDQGQLELIDDLESAAIKLRQFIDRIRTAAYGYSGFFDAIKINKDDLKRAYEYDYSLFDLADQISRAIDNVEASIGTDGLPAALRNIRTLSKDAVDAFVRRMDVLRGIDSSSEATQ
ncbi:MAG TPA: hypothetical protein PKD55_09275 [Bellilinea sp.]|nr:hypothetical protein [Bellilinea sp.]